MEIGARSQQQHVQARLLNKSYLLIPRLLHHKTIIENCSRTSRSHRFSKKKESRYFIFETYAEEHFKESAGNCLS